jgi:hypothetical protein
MSLEGVILGDADLRLGDEIAITLDGKKDTLIVTRIWIENSVARFAAEAKA